MARYVRDFTLEASSAEQAFYAVYQYLASEGYTYQQVDGKAVFQKGNGWISGPSFVQISYQPFGVRIEAWVKFALLPGVFIGELGVDGMMGVAVKRPLKKRLAQIESTLAYYGGAAMQTPIQTPVQAAQPMVARNCSRCGAPIAPNTSFCTQCGQPTEQVQATGRVISKREFYERYLPGLKKDLRGVGILCYVCVVLNSALAMAVSPWMLIDSLLLLGFALGTHLGKSKVCAVLLLILGCVEVLAGIVETGTPSGILWLIAGISAVTVFRKADKQYAQFLAANSNGW